MAEKEELGIEVISTGIEKITAVAEDIRSKAQDGLTKAEIFQIAIGSSDEAIWIASHLNDFIAEAGDVDGDLTEGETKEIVDKILVEYDAPTPEEEYAIERTIYAFFAARDAVNAWKDFLNSRK